MYNITCGKATILHCIRAKAERQHEVIEYEKQETKHSTDGQYCYADGTGNRHADNQWLHPTSKWFSISLVLIPIVIGGAVYGPGAGALLGATFGVIVYINCVTGADYGGAMVFQANPILCFLVVMGKGILSGLSAGFVYSLFKSKNTYVAMLLAAIVCPLVNTGIFVLCMWMFFIDILVTWAGGGEILGYILTGLVFANMLPELLVNIIFSPAGARITHIMKMRNV